MAPGVLDTVKEQVPITPGKTTQSVGNHNPSLNRDQSKHYDAVVIGAGWAGLWTLYRLRQRGFNAVIIEAHEDVGGKYTHQLIYTRHQR